ncbi:hypothetical protein AMTRI_Chr05g72420 [Amborella trichopoda]
MTIKVLTLLSMPLAPLAMLSIFFFLVSLSMSRVLGSFPVSALGAALMPLVVVLELSTSRLLRVWHFSIMLCLACSSGVILRAMVLVHGGWFMARSGRGMNG